MTVSRRPLMGSPTPKRVPRLLSVPEVAEALDVCTRTVRRQIAAGALPALRIGRSVRISEDELRAFLLRCQQR